MMVEAVRRSLAATLVAPSLVRRFFRAWLDELRWPAQDSEDLVLAVSEAVSNVVDHAYPEGSPGDVLVEAWCRPGKNGDRFVEVRVRDRGTWRPPPIWHENRRRGLQLMRACTSAMRVKGTDGGTVVELISRPVRVV
jgi:anti-sigma regulatory factor (Ser/Thr protein kinase)